jgi:hypothetical protein
MSTKPPAARTRADEDPHFVVEGMPSGQLKSSLGRTAAAASPPLEPAGLGIDSAGQSGDTVGLSREEFSSESVEDLTEEGQAYEAAFVAGVEEAAEAGDAGVPRLHPRKEEAP